MFFEEFHSYKTKITTSHCFLNFLEITKSNEQFINNLCEQVFEKPIICLSKNNTYMLGTLFLRTAIRTLNSISICCSYGCFADSNILVRKYRDDLFLYLFIIEVLNKRKGLDDHEISEILPGEMDADKLYNILISTIEIITQGSKKDKNDRAVDAWFDDEVFGGNFRNELSIDNYLKYLKQNSEIQRCILEYGMDATWEEIRQRLNDYTHANGKKFIQHNLLEYLNIQEIDKCILKLSNDISFITAVFLVFLILIKPDFIMASDYTDYIELGFEPPEDSQYWVAPFIREYIDENLVKLHPELKPFLHNNNKYGMIIE